MKGIMRKVIMGVIAVATIIFFVGIVFLVRIIIELSSFEPFTVQNYFESYPTGNQLELYETNAEIVIPADASEIYVYTTGFNEISTRIRFSIISSELDSFIQNTICTEPLTEYYVNTSVPANGETDPWTLKEGSNYTRCLGARENTHQTIIVDITDPNTYIVYIFSSVY